MSLHVRALTKRFGHVVAADRVSFEVADGEFVSLLGPSGCGKTTTLRCIAGLEEPDGGEIEIDGEVVSRPETGVTVPSHLRNIGMVFQSYAVWPHMTVFGNVAFPLEMQKLRAAAVRERVDWALELVGLRHLEDRPATQLSGGQQQRVAFARAIVRRPRLLLFDEPLSNLDARLRDRTRGELRRLQRELSVATVYVTHDQAEALSLSDRVIVLDAGRVVQDATPRELYRRPGTEFVADFVGAANIFEVVAHAAEGHRLTGSAPDGSTILLPESSAAVGAGRQKLAIRPEQMRLGPRGAEGGWGEGWNLMHGEVRQALFMGSHTEYAVDVGGTMIRVVSADEIAEVKVVVAFRPEDCVVVAAEEGTT